MGRFKAKQDAIVRELKEVTIILCGSKVYVYPAGQKFGSVFFRRPGEYGWTKLGSYPDWQRFYLKMLRCKNLTPTKCYELAIECDLVGMSIDRRLNLEEMKVIKRD